MIQLIGYQKSLILAVLVIVTGILAFVNFSMFGPQARKATMQLGGIQSEEARLRQEVSAMRGEQEQFEEQKALFEILKLRNFFGDQDRVHAREVLGAMQRQAKLLSVKYEIRSAGALEFDGITDEKYAVMSSPIAIEIEAVDDLDVYNFIYLLTYRFPGQVSIKKLDIVRPVRLTTDVLKSIGTGSPIPLIRAKIEAEWNTVVPRESIPVTPGDGAAR